jgi:F0F1-type ATP synthase membrane subunit c/vacuolar-type H+-ATPase subunit K
MPHREQQASENDLLVPWIIFISLLVSLAVYVVIGYTAGASLRTAASDEPVVLRSVFYAVSIATFPLITLVRHICLRLNQTMTTPTPAKARYLVTVVISLFLAESMGIYGVVLALLGDGINSLWIFTFLAVLAMLLFRPKFSEYQEIVAALNAHQHQRTHVR